MTIFCHIVTKPLPDRMNNASRTHSAYALNLVEDASQKGYDLLQGLNISRQELNTSDLLIKGTHPKSDIAVKLGYEKPGNFTRACGRLLAKRLITFVIPDYE